MLTSNVLFLSSCAGGFFTSYFALQDMGGQYMDDGAKPSESMALIAAIPDPGRQGAIQLKHVALRDLEKFRAVEPVHSFLLPPGSGKIQGRSAAFVTYEVKPAGDDRVLVETKYRQSMGGLVIARYEATNKVVRPIFTNNVQWLVALAFGLALAIVLYIVGRVLRRFAARHP